MTKIQKGILYALKRKIEYKDEEYSQWIMAISMKQEASECSGDGTLSFVARVIVMTNESPYVDGTDAGITMVLDEVLIDTDSLDGPIFHGGTVEHALEWVRALGEPFYIQLENPF